MLNTVADEKESKSPEINVLFRVRVKADRIEEFYRLAGTLMQASREESGCVSFTYHQSLKDAADFFLYEQWRDQPSLKGHLARLVEQYGPPEGGGFLPKVLTDYWDSMEATKYRVVE